MKAQKDGDADRANLLLRSLILPQPMEWYVRVFGPTIAENEGALYQRASASVPKTMAEEFHKAAELKPDGVEAQRFDRSCNDNAGEFTFGILNARIEPVPLYEVQFHKGNKIMSSPFFAYVDGAFRFIVTPKLEGRVFPPTARQAAGEANTPHPGEPAEVEKRLKVGGNVLDAKKIHNVLPVYPEIAKEEHLEGKVLMHALIDKDGSLQKAYVLHGYCTLAESALDAVKKWKYSPTTLNGDPVEIETQIEVIYSLH
jgi:TonB family protein